MTEVGGCADADVAVRDPGAVVFEVLWAVVLVLAGVVSSVRSVRGRCEGENCMICAW